MNLLGIDFGESKIGLALAVSPLAEPIGVVKDIEDVVKICREQEIGKIIIGLSEGEMAKKQRRFGQKLSGLTGLPVEFQDETLTTKEAITKMKEVKKKIKDKEEDSFAASLILQDYLDRMGE